MSLAVSVIFMTSGEFCLRWALKELSDIIPQPLPYRETLTATIIKTYPTGHVFPGFSPLEKDFRLVKITSPIVVDAEPNSLNDYLSGCCVSAYAYYMPTDEPMPDYPEPGSGPYEGGETTPQPGGGRSGGGGASGEWGVKRDPDTGGGWYLPIGLIGNTITAAANYTYDDINHPFINQGIVAFFWVFSGEEKGKYEGHITEAPFHSWISYGTTVAFLEHPAGVESDLIDAPGYNGYLCGYRVGRYTLQSGDVYINEIRVNIVENPDYPAMYFPPRDSELPETPGFLVPKGQGSIIPAVVALMGLRLWGKKRGTI